VCTADLIRDRFEKATIDKKYISEHRAHPSTPIYCEIMPFGGAIHATNISISKALAETIDDIAERLDSAEEYDFQVGIADALPETSSRILRELEESIRGFRGLKGTALFPVAFEQPDAVNPFKLGQHLYFMQAWLGRAVPASAKVPALTPSMKVACRSLLARISAWYAVHLYRCGSRAEMDEMVALTRLAAAFYFDRPALTS